MNVRFTGSEDLAAVARFNRRLEAGGREEKVLLQPTLPGEARYRPEGFPVYRRLMIAEDEKEVRAAILLYHHSVFVRGQRRDFCWSDMPVSEGVVDRKYALSIVQLMKSAISYQPFLMTLGVGNPDVEAFRFWVKFGWRHKALPFFFYPVKVNRVLLGLNYFKTNFKLRLGAALAAYSGLGIELGGLLAMRRRLGSRFSAYSVSEVSAFDDWADGVFKDSLPDYGVAVLSDATALNIVYPPDHPGFARLRVRRKRAGSDAGWIVVANKQMSGNPYFGDLKVGTLVDGFGRAADAPALVAAGIDYLAEIGVDIIVANFSHAAWVRACRRSGMLPGPSNYYLFVSPGGSPLLEERCPLREIHLARGHSDGLAALI